MAVPDDAQSVGTLNANIEARRVVVVQRQRHVQREGVHCLRGPAKKKNQSNKAVCACVSGKAGEVNGASIAAGEGM